MSEQHPELSGGTQHPVAQGRTSPITFIRQVIAELRKVVWPTRPMVVSYFFVVLVFVLVMMAIVAGLDFGFGKLMFKVFG